MDNFFLSCRAASTEFSGSGC